MRGPVQLISSVMGCANPVHLSPVQEATVAGNVGVFHMRPDFDLVADNRDVSGRPETLEQEEVRSRKSDRKNNVAHHSDKQQQKDSQRRRQEEREKELDMKPTTSMQSDESDEKSDGNSTRPSETMSLSLEETLTDPANDPITANRTNSNSVESPRRGKQWSGELSPDRSSQDDADKKRFFNGGGNGRTSSFGSSKGVSFSDSSIAESERERKLDPEPQQQQRSVARQKVDAVEHRSLKEPPKAEDRRADKFGRAKTKRREMKDRRQDENGERSTPPSKNSPSPSRRPHTQSSQPPVSPSVESMAYSLDSASYFRPPVANTNTNDGGGSVMTTGTENQSLLSYVTRSTMVQSRFQEDDGGNAHTEEDEDDDISLSLLESGSSFVPSDEELNAAGWAKAMDQSSGSYYYFTLDRTKTIWENPLGISP